MSPELIEALAFAFLCITGAIVLIIAVLMSLTGRFPRRIPRTSVTLPPPTPQYLRWTLHKYHNPQVAGTKKEVDEDTSEKGPTLH